MKEYGGEQIDQLFQQIVDLLPTCDPVHVRAHAYGLLRDIRSEEVRRSDGSDAKGSLVSRAQAVMKRSFPNAVTAEYIAQACEVSPSVLKREFQKQTGKTLHQWSQQQRMAHAQSLLLESDLTITQIAAQAGYANPSKFARAFRAETGESPSAWRDARL